MGSVVMPESDLINKLIVIASGNIELVSDAIHFTAKRKSVTIRCGFLWLRKREDYEVAADLKDVVDFIVRNRDTHDGHAHRRRTNSPYRKRVSA